MKSEVIVVIVVVLTIIIALSPLWGLMVLDVYREWKQLRRPQ
jgi:hypothetical protein